MDLPSNSLWLNVLLAGVIFMLAVLLPWLVKKSQKGRPINPVAEANVYLAYGRKEQALDVLRSALVADPNNEEVLAKLREIEHK